MKVSEFVAQARDHLSAAWTKGSYRNSQDQSVCAIGALDRVAMENLQQGGVQAHSPAREALLVQAREMFNLPSLNYIPGLNDEMGRTKQDMLDLFDKTVIGLEEHGE